MQIAIDPTTEMWSRAFKTSIYEEISVYDAIYMAASLVLDAKMVTSDEMLIERLSSSAKKRVILLTELNF
jgi:predicted nucleic acid-binding protein